MKEKFAGKFLNDLWRLLVRYYPIGLLFLFAAYRLYIGSYNYSGYCFDEGKYLTDQEKIVAVVNEILKQYPPPVISHVVKNDDVMKNKSATNKRTNRRVTENTPPGLPIYYRNLDEFFQINSACCKVTAVRGIDDEPPTFWERVTGKVSAFVSVNYLVRYQDETGHERSTSLSPYPAVSNCGRPVWNR